VATGRKVAVQAAGRLIPAYLELGGKDPLIVLEGADIDTATDAALRGSVLSTGQACQSIERIYVARSIHDAFLDRLVEKAQAARLNWPDITAGEIGPIIFDRQADILSAQIADARKVGRRLSDASDAELRRFVRENQSQTREIVLQLDGLGTAEAVSRLRKHLGRTDGDLPTLLEAFFSVTDETFDARYRFFYDELAPLLSLYRAKVGDRITLRSFARTGSASTVTLTLHGIFELKGLEKSPLAGVNTLIDLVSLRDLYGLMNDEAKAEAAAMKAQVGASQVARDEAEAALFGETAEVVVDAKAQAIVEDKQTRSVKKQEDTFDPAEAKKGVVLHAAVLLRAGADGDVTRTLAAIEERLSSSKRPPDENALAAVKAALESGRLPPAVSMTLQPAVALESERVAGRTPATTAARYESCESAREGGKGETHGQKQAAAPSSSDKRG
jgi:hypothetical protein